MPSKALMFVFEHQFTRKGDHFIYRKGSKGPPIRVTAAERDAFVARFRRDYFRLMLAGFGLVLATGLLAAKLGWFDNRADMTVLALGFAGAAAVWIGLLGWGSVWICGAPDRALARRLPGA